MSEEVKQHKSTNPKVTFSSAALEHIRKQLNHQQEVQGLRLSLVQSGCSGYSYVLDFINDIPDDDLVCPIDENLTVYLERKNLPLLLGTSIDFVKQGLNYKFIYNNPQQKGLCGCGESFTV